MNFNGDKPIHEKNKRASLRSIAFRRSGIAVDAEIRHTRTLDFLQNFLHISDSKAFGRIVTICQRGDMAGTHTAPVHLNALAPASGVRGSYLGHMD